MTPIASSRIRQVTTGLALAVLLAVVGCQFPGTSSSDTTLSSGADVTASTIVTGLASATVTTADPPGAASTDGGPGVPPTLSGAPDDSAATNQNLPGSQAGEDGEDVAGSPPPATIGGSAATPGPGPSGATPGITAQPGDANDAFGGGGPVRCPAFPADNWWNRDVSGLPVHARSAAWVTSMGTGRIHPDFGSVWDGKAIGIPYVVVGSNQARVAVSFDYANESDPGPYPIPARAPIEDGSDHHVIVVDDAACKLYELFDATPLDGGSRWRAGSGATFDLRSNGLRPAGWTSADAAGLPIFAGLVTYQEVVVDGRIDHALRFTASRTQQAYIRPATHYASSITDPDVPPMGARFRLKASFDCSPFSREAQVVCAALKTYGMFLADNGSDWMISGAPDPRWNDQALADLHGITGAAFEVVDTGEPITG